MQRAIDPLDLKLAGGEVPGGLLALAGALERPSVADEHPSEDRSGALLRLGVAAAPPEPGKVDRWERFVREFTIWARSRGFFKIIGAIEIWNEPNAENFWGRTDPDAPRYAALYNAAYRAIRQNAAQPGRRVDILTAGLKPEAGTPTYLKNALTAIDPNKFPDGVGVHAYANSSNIDSLVAPDHVKNDYLAIGRALSDIGRGHTPRWVTEFGYPTLTNVGDPLTQQAQDTQALTMQAMWQRLVGGPVDRRPEAVLVHRLLDDPYCGDDCNLEKRLMGTVFPDGNDWVAKPSYCTMAALFRAQGNPAVC